MVRSACSGALRGRALEFRYHSYKAVKNILANGLDKIDYPSSLSANQPSLPLHANIRGNDYVPQQGRSR